MGGTLIVIDGADGAGKTTQTERLIARATERGLSATSIHFPSYHGTEGGRIVQRYLHGEFGDPTSIHPVLASIPYALDRHEQSAHVRELLATHDLVVADRYVISNMAFQGAKLAESERQPFTEWAAMLDYEVFKNPREAAVVFLSVPTALSTALIKGRSTTGRKQDLHEKNRLYQARVLAQYHWLCSYYPHWYLVDSSQNTHGELGLRTVDAIATDVEQILFEKVIPAQERIAQEAQV